MEINTFEINVKTITGKGVIVGKFYELKYKWGAGYKYGYGWINPEFGINTNVDIICHDGGVTYTDLRNVIFLKQIKQ